MFYRRIWSIVGKYSILCCDTKVQWIMWRELNDLMAKNGVENTNFKGFMVDSALHAELSMAMVIQRSPRRTESALVSSTGPHR
jgi:hypothetical protein